MDTVGGCCLRYRFATLEGVFCGVGAFDISLGFLIGSDMAEKVCLADTSSCGSRSLLVERRTVMRTLSRVVVYGR